MGWTSSTLWHEQVVSVRLQERSSSGDRGVAVRLEYVIHRRFELDAWELEGQVLRETHRERMRRVATPARER